MLTYRNVVKKLDKKITTSKEFANAQRVESYMREERTAINRAAGKPVGSRYAYKNNPPSEEKIRSIYHTIDQGDKPFQGEFANMLRTTQHTLSLLRKRDLSIISDKEWSYLMSMLDDSSDIINNYLTKKRKANGRAA